MNLYGTTTLIGIGLLSILLATRRRVRWLGAVSGTSVLILSGWLAHQDRQYGTIYERAANGAPKATVVDQLGSATDVTLGASDPDGGTLDDSHHCAVTLWYNSFFSIERYQFCYSADDKLVHKYRWTSW